MVTTVAIFLVAVTAELGGVYAVWQWRRHGGSLWLVPVGLAALFLYAVIQTFQSQSQFGRLYAAYAGVFLVGAMTSGWLLEGFRPDRFDLIGAGIVIFGIVTILWGRSLLA